MVAFPLSRDVHAYVRFLLTKPESNDFYVNGSILASSWNRGQALVAMSRVRLEGNLPPSLVSIRSRRGGRLVSGFALDFARHPVVGIPVTLERRSGSGWTRRRDRSHDADRRLHVQGRAGSYRARAQLGIALLGDQRRRPDPRRHARRTTTSSIRSGMSKFA